MFRYISKLEQDFKQVTDVTYTNTNNWMNGREMIRQTSGKQTKRPNTSQATEQNDCRKCRKTLAAQVAKAILAATTTTPKATSIKNDLIFNLRISREFRFIQFVFVVRNIKKLVAQRLDLSLRLGVMFLRDPWGLCNTSQYLNELMRRFFSSFSLVSTESSAGFYRVYLSCISLLRLLSNMQNVALSRCCFVTFCKQRQRNEQIILFHLPTQIHFPIRGDRVMCRVKTL